MNAVVRPVTPDGDSGFDIFDQFIVWVPDTYGGKTGTIRHDVRGQICPLCGKHWELTSISLNDQMYLRSVRQVVHQTCYMRYAAHQERADLIEDLGKATIFDFKISEILNEYRGTSGQPWYIINPDGKTEVLKFGRRKRVYSMRFGMLTIQQQAMLEAGFALDDTTKSKESGENGLAYLIHAWTRDDVVRYLDLWKKAIES
jgi:hypothetical protein